MSMIKKITLAGTVTLSLLSNVAIAGIPTEMQSAANAQAHAIRKAVNIHKATIHCKQATLRIASAAKMNGGKLKGASLRSAIMEATSTAARKYNIEDGCVTPVYATKAASRLTGIYPSTGPTLGVAKLGGVGGLAGAAGVAAAGATSAFGGIGGLGILAGALGIAAIVGLGSGDDNCMSASTSC